MNDYYADAYQKDMVIWKTTIKTGIHGGSTGMMVGGG